MTIEWLIQRTCVFGAFTHDLKAQCADPDDTFHARVRIQNVEQEEDGQLELSASLADEGAEILVAVHGFPEQGYDFMGPSEGPLNDVQSIAARLQLCMNEYASHEHGSEKDSRVGARSSRCLRREIVNVWPCANGQRDLGICSVAGSFPEKSMERG